MNKIRRFFNQYRETIFRVIIIIIACFIALRLVNNIIKSQNKKEANTINNTTSVTGDEDYAIISDEKIDSGTYKVQSNLIEQFLEYCNNKNIEQAYDLLSQECKDVLYPSIDEFKSKYVEKVFNTNKTYSIQAWNASTYKIKITEDLLATGKSGNKDYIEDYFTIVGKKLNINSFSDSLRINKEQEKANVKINMKKIDIYMDYSIIKFEITNGRDTSIMLNTEDYADNVYLMDEDELKFVALLHELSPDEFIIGAGQNKEVAIKFDVPYSKIDEIEYFRMDNVIANYEQYKELGDSRVIQFSIEI